MQDDIEKAFQDELKDHAFNQEVMRTGLEIAYIDIDFKAGCRAHAARSGWVLVSEIEKHFDFSKYGEHESIEMVAINDGQSEEWEHGRLQLKCDYDDGEKLKPAFGINHSYAECVFATDYKYFKRISPPPQSKGG